MTNDLMRYLEGDSRRTAQTAIEKVASAVARLPVNEIAHLARYGQIKTASFCGDHQEWLQQFAGTPLLPQAIQLAQADLANDTQRQQMDQRMRQQREMADMPIQAESDRIRTEKRLLEIELAKASMAAEAAPPVTAPPISAADVVPADGPAAGAEPPPQAGPPTDLAKAAAAMRETIKQAGVFGQVAEAAKAVAGKAAPAVSQFARQNLTGAAIGAGVGALGGAAQGAQKDQNGQRSIGRTIAGGLGGAVVGAGVGAGAQHGGRALMADPSVAAKVQGAGEALKNKWQAMRGVPGAAPSVVGA